MRLHDLYFYLVYFQLLPLTLEDHTFMMSTKNHQFLTPPRSANTWQNSRPHPSPPLSSNFCVDVIEVRFLYLPSRVKQSVNFPTYCNSYSLKCSCAHNLGSLQCGIPFYISIMIFLACLGVTLNGNFNKIYNFNKLRGRIAMNWVISRFWNCRRFWQEMLLQKALVS